MLDHYCKVTDIYLRRVGSNISEGGEHLHNIIIWLRKVTTGRYNCTLRMQSRGVWGFVYITVAKGHI